MAMSFVIALTSCSKSQDLDYKKACEEKDFEKAYQIVDIIKEDAAQTIADNEPNGFDDEDMFHKLAIQRKARVKVEEVEKYVVLQESMYVLESQGTNGLIRIVGIAKEHNAERWLYKELLDIAKKIGDNDLVERINNMINPSPASDTSVKI